MKSTHRCRPQAHCGMTLLELTVVILVLLGLVSILFIGGRAWKRGADRSGCVMNIRNVQQAVRSYQNLEEVDYGAAIDVSGDLVGSGNFIQAEPVCPANGTYSLASTMPEMGTLVMTCSLAVTEDHVPRSYAGW